MDRPEAIALVPLSVADVFLLLGALEAVAREAGPMRRADLDDLARRLGASLEAGRAVSRALGSVADLEGFELDPDALAGALRGEND
jgi:hypothetical protein